MKTLNLDNYCVQEMSAVEMREAEGGNPYRTVIKFLEYLGVVALAEAFEVGFTEGAKEGYNDQQKKK